MHFRGSIRINAKLLPAHAVPMADLVKMIPDDESWISAGASLISVSVKSLSAWASLMADLVKMISDLASLIIHDALLKPDGALLITDYAILTGDDASLISDDDSLTGFFPLPNYTFRIITGVCLLRKVQTWLWI